MKAASGHIPRPFYALFMIPIITKLLIAVNILVSILLIFVILLQRPKNEGLGAAFGGDTASNIFGAQTTNVLANITRWLGGIFMVLTLVISILYSRQDSFKSSNTKTIEAEVAAREAEVKAEKAKAEEAAKAAAANPAPATTTDAAAAESAVKEIKVEEGKAPEATPAPAPAPGAGSPGAANPSTPPSATPAAPVPATPVPTTPAPATPAPAEAPKQ